MIYEKALKIPTQTKRRIKRGLTLFSEQEDALFCRGLHFRKKGRGLVMAEGAEYLSALPEGALSLHCSFGHGERVYVYRSGNSIIPLDGSIDFPSPVPKRVIVYVTDEGEELLLILGEYGLSWLKEGLYMSLANVPAGDCACLAAERLLIAKGNKVSWSSPLNASNWQRSLEGAGYVELPSQDGNILEMIPLKEYVYLFREKGITRLTVKGDPLTFAAESLPCAFGRIVKGSVQLCGDKVVFLTEQGAYCFDGTKVARLSECGFSEIVLGNEILTASFAGKYAAAVTLQSGEDCVWILDPTEGEGHFLRIKADMLAGGETLVFANGGNLYRLTGRGLPLKGEYATLFLERSLLGLSSQPKYLDGVTIDGEGFFLVEGTSERGVLALSEGRAGELLKFPSPLRGVGFALKIRSRSANALVKSVTFDVREVSA